MMIIVSPVSLPEKGEPDLSDKLGKRSKNFRNVLDKETKMVRARKADGHGVIRKITISAYGVVLTPKECTTIKRIIRCSFPMMFPN